MKRLIVGSLVLVVTACGEDRAPAAASGEDCCECLATRAYDGSDAIAPTNCLPSGGDELSVCEAGVEVGTIEIANELCITKNAACRDSCLPALKAGLRIESEYMVAGGANGQAYFAHTSQIGGPTWFEARDRCKADGGHLATITGAQEVTLVEGLLIGNSQSWIGLNDLQIEGAFQWVDGSPMSFTRFEPGQPDDGQNTIDKESEDCVNIVHLANVWVDDTCDGTQGSWVCEVD